MPRPILKKNNIIDIVKRSIDLVKMSSKNKINLIVKSKDTLINGDEDQLNRVFINLINHRRKKSYDTLFHYKKNRDWTGFAYSY